MKNNCNFYVSLLAGALLPIAFGANAAERKTNIDSGWQFQLADKQGALNADGWRQLDLPHDWSVEPDAARMAGGEVIGPFSTNSVGKYQTGNTVGGEGWYRKNLRFSKDDLKKGRKQLYFEGAYNHATVLVNGKQAVFNPYGYSSFKADITDLLKPGDNLVEVKVENKGNNTRWYAGSGIYRHVWLLDLPEIAFNDWDTFVRTDGDLVKVSTTLDNTSSKAKKTDYTVSILNNKGELVASKSGNATVAANGKAEVNLEIPVQTPSLWSTDDPTLYKAVIKLGNPKKPTDEVTKRFGFRTLEYNAQEGFSVNGKPTLIKGGCVHHDHGLLGAASYDKAEERKIRLLKERGYNALRTSHGLPSEHFLDMCVSLGMMVLDETFDQWYLAKNDDDYHNYFPEYHTQDLEVMIRRDRNHPSIIMWGLGNEIPGRIEPKGMEVAEEMRQTILALDPTRPITAAICGWDAGDAWNAAGQNWDQQDAKAFQSLDIGGYNYLFGNYAHDHGTHPDRVMCGLESYPKEIAQNWQMVEKNPYVIGDFIWTAMDYLGEAGIGSAFYRKNGEGWQGMFQAWPWFNGWCGDVDLIGQQKPQSYFHDVAWGLRPVAMAVARPVPEGYYDSVTGWGWPQEEQNWTFPEYNENDTLTVSVISRAPRVRLYLNGENLGETAPDSLWRTNFTVAYRPGTLRAVNLDQAGKEVKGEEFTLVTTGKPAAIRVIADKSSLDANNPQDLAYVTFEVVDRNGNVVVNDALCDGINLDITVDGEGAEMIAAGNASPTDMKSFRVSNPRPFRGRALAILKSTGKTGDAIVKVSASGLTEGKLSLSAR